MAIKKLEGAEPTGTYLPRELKERLRKIARAAHRSLSEQIAFIVTKWMLANADEVEKLAKKK